MSGKEATYGVTVSNNGPSGATGVVLTDTLPEGVAFISATPSQGTCSESGGVITCDLGDIKKDAEVTITVVGRADVDVGEGEIETLTGSLKVSGDDFDAATDNNETPAVTNVYRDEDADNIGDQIEDGGPNDGDGNENGVPDSEEENVTSLKDSVDLEYTTIGSEEGTRLVDVEAGDNPSPEDTPDEEFPAGFFKFTVDDVDNGSSTSVEIVLPEDDEIEEYRNYGPTPDDPEPHWYKFDFDGETGAVVQDNEVTLHLVDGGRGDHDLTEDGKITTEGAPVLAFAELFISVADSPDPVFVAEDVTYTLVVSNGGPSQATGVVVTDTLPADVAFVSASEGCSESGGVVTCEVGDMAFGASVTLTITVEPEEAAGGTSITTVATVAGNQEDPDETNNSAPAATEVVPVADLSIAKSGLPVPVGVNEKLTYTLEVTNAGPSQATGVALSDTLPEGVTLVSLDPRQGSCTEEAGVVTCELGALDSGATATVEITVIPAAPGTITNVAAVNSDITDPEEANNTATLVTEIDPRADLTITKTSSPDPVLLGQELSYSVTVTNAGPSEAVDVVVSDTLSEGVTFASASEGCTESDGTVTCDAGTIGSGDSVTVSIVVLPASTGDLTNVASVTSGTTDPSTGDNEASQTTTVVPAASIVLAKSSSPDPVLLGKELTYTLTVSNSGPSDAPDVVATDTLPGDVTFVSSSSSIGTCSGTDTVVCTIGTLVAGNTATVTIVVIPSSVGDLVNVASVKGGVDDPNPDDNTISQTTASDPAVDVALEKSDVADTVLVNAELTYTLTVINNGPSDASRVTLTDTLPENATFVSASEGCSESGGTVLCTIGTLTNGESVTVVIVVVPIEVGTITNKVSVGSGQSDPDARNNSGSQSTNVILPARADLSLSMTDATDEVPVEQPLVYTLTLTNAGPAEATNVVLTDTLPGKVAFESAVPSQGNCSHQDGTVQCELGTLGSGDVTVEITVIPTVDAGGTTITNEASVRSGGVDPPTTSTTAPRRRRGSSHTPISPSHTPTPPTPPRRAERWTTRWSSPTMAPPVPWRWW